ncbi:MAG: hypothetical protein ACRDIV_23010 [Ktedonobacteraceae bacterium]
MASDDDGWRMASMRDSIPPVHTASPDRSGTGTYGRGSSTCDNNNH